MSNFWRDFKFTLFAHILNPLWDSRLKRRIRRGEYKWKRTENYLKKYKEYAEALKVDDEKSESCLSEMRKRHKAGDYVFSIWFQGEENAPKLVKECFRRLRAVYGEKFVVLDNTTLWDWIELPEHVLTKWRGGKIIAANFSDICRIELLYTYGGMWFDATDFLTKPVPAEIAGADLFMFMEGGKITPTTLIQSCFMRAARGNALYAMWRKMLFHYWEGEENAIDYFLAHYLLRFIIENNREAARLFDRMPKINQDPTHFLWFRDRNKPYSEQLYREATEHTFFQKTNFKCKDAVNPAPGTVADFIVNGKIPI